MTSQPTEIEGLAVIVVHHRSTLTVQDTVLDLLSAGLQPPQIHVVDNSEDEETSRELQAGLPGGVCMSTVPNLGYANAVNVGVDHLSVIASSATSILVVTHDVRLAPGALEKMLYALVRDTGVAAVGPLIVNGHRKSRVWSAGGRSTKLLHLPRHTFAGQNADTVPPETVNVDWLDGSVVLYRASVLRGQRILEEFFLYVEEYEYHTRLRSMGFEIVCAREARASQTSNGAPPFLKARNLQIFEYLHGGLLAATLGVPFEVFREVLRVLLRRQRLSYVVQMFAGWRSAVRSRSERGDVRAFSSDLS